FVLAAVYPFFAILAIVPGRAGAFFMWMAMWAWLKSWDIGWAFVMIVDQVLWTLMPHTAYYRMVPSGTGFRIETDPVTVFEAAFAGDYAYNLTTYYLLLSGVITAVPVVTAHALLGSKKAVAGILINGVKTIAQPFSKAASDWLASEHAHENDSYREKYQFG